MKYQPHRATLVGDGTAKGRSRVRNTPCAAAAAPAAARAKSRNDAKHPRDAV
jgi:hypothetical protein